MNLDQITTALDRRLERLRLDIDSLEQARAALTEPVTGGSATRSRPARPAATRRRRRRAPGRRDAVPAEKIERVLGLGGSLSTTEIAGRTDGDRTQVLARLRELEAAGKVVRSGERRGTRWAAFSGQDWVARRAAELSARA